MKLWSKIVSRIRYGLPPALFDGDWYLSNYEDVRTSGADAWAHFMGHGIDEGRQPNVMFSPSWYIGQNPDVAARGTNPFLHYVRHGSVEKRKPHPLFDIEWYCSTYPDVLDSKVEPLLHFLKYGMAEGRLPNPHFDPGRYVAAFVNSTDKLNPVEHYVRHGLLGYGSATDAVLYAGNPGIGFDATKQTYFLGDQDNAYAYVPSQKPRDSEAVILGFSKNIKFSIVVPVYNTPVGLLEKLFQSLLDQWYENWEVIFIDDCSSHEHLNNSLGTMAGDSRVSVLRTSRNEGISGATNIGLEHADGEYIVFLDHDDELTDDCLFELATAIDQTGADFIYSDEDKIAEDGRYIDPFFKPDWSPDTFMSTMFTCHVSCVRSRLIDRVGRFRSEYDGAQDWDFILRVTEKADKIVHIPKVLYHWRVLPNSIAADLDAKPKAVERSKKARQDAIERRGFAGSMVDVETVRGHSVPVYERPKDKSVSIVIPTRDNLCFLSKCIGTLRKKTVSSNYDVVIVDNGSEKPETLAYFDEIGKAENITVYRYEVPFNFSRLCNFGASKAEGDVIIFLNDDTEIIEPDWLERLAGHACLPHAGAVGAKLLYGHDRSIQHNGIVNLADGPGHAFVGRGEDEHGYFARNVLDGNWIAVTAACLALERKKFDQVGGFDESLAVAYNDVDLCFRLLEAGYYNINCATVKLIHHESVSRGHDQLSDEKRQRLKREKRILFAKHPRFYMWDPFFNPNFHGNDPQFRLSYRWEREQ